MLFTLSCPYLPMTARTVSALVLIGQYSGSISLLICSRGAPRQYAPGHLAHWGSRVIFLSQLVSMLFAGVLVRSFLELPCLPSFDRVHHCPTSADKDFNTLLFEHLYGPRP